LLAAAAIALVLVACGRASAGGSSEPTPTPTPTIVPLPAGPAPGFDVLVTDQDRAVSVHVGQKIEVFLRTRPGMTPWSGIRTDSAVLQPVNVAIVQPPRGAAVAGFVALKPGTVDVIATAGPDCAPNQACPAYAVLYSVTVTVV
jgi:hypothetical protein